MPSSTHRTIAPPEPFAIYAVAAIAAAVVSAYVAWRIGAFRDDPHPDPTRGSYAWVFVTLAASVTFLACSGTLVLGRWLIWKDARTTSWKLQAGAFLILLCVAFGAWLVAHVYSKHRSDDGGRRTLDAGTPVAEGIRPAYFPSEHMRYEKPDPSSSSRRFREFAVDGALAYRREGFTGHPGRVSLRTFSSPDDAQRAIEALGAKAEREGYRRVPSIPGA